MLLVLFESETPAASTSTEGFSPEWFSLVEDSSKVSASCKVFFSSSGLDPSISLESSNFRGSVKLIAPSGASVTSSN